MNLYYLDISHKFTSFKLAYEDADFNFLFTGLISWDRIIMRLSFNLEPYSQPCMKTKSTC
jgi:hypothetical protein